MPAHLVDRRAARQLAHVAGSDELRVFKREVARTMVSSELSKSFEHRLREDSGAAIGPIFVA